MCVSRVPPAPIVEPWEHRILISVCSAPRELRAALAAPILQAVNHAPMEPLLRVSATRGPALRASLATLWELLEPQRVHSARRTHSAPRRALLACTRA